MDKYLALDFGGSGLKSAVISEDFKIEKYERFDPPLESIDKFINICHMIVKKNGNIKGLAISLPGRIDDRSGYVYSAGMYKKIYNVNLIIELQEKIDLPISIINDANAAIF